MTSEPNNPLPLVESTALFGSSEVNGRALYEAECKQQPNYHDGKPRKKWEELGAVEQWSWNRPKIKIT